LALVYRFIGDFAVILAYLFIYLFKYATVLYNIEYTRTRVQLLLGEADRTVVKDSIFPRTRLMDAPMQAATSR